MTRRESGVELGQQGEMSVEGIYMNLGLAHNQQEVLKVFKGIEIAQLTVNSIDNHCLWSLPSDSLAKADEVNMLAGFLVAYASHKTLAEWRVRVEAGKLLLDLAKQINSGEKIKYLPPWDFEKVFTKLAENERNIFAKPVMNNYAKQAAEIKA
jgi:hypothetical protein